MQKLQLALLTLVFATTACRCGGPQTTATAPEVIADSNGLSVEACPVVDAQSQPVEGAVPTEGVVTLTNVGLSTATLALTIEGANADLFTLGEFDAQLAPDNSVDVPIFFAPKTAGAVSALLKVDDGDPETPVLDIALSGSGLNLPAQPTLKVSVESAPGSNTFTPCEEGFLCTVDYPDVFFGQTVTQRVRLENTGCPALKINGLSITKGVIGNNLAFFLDNPATPPTELSPLLLNLTDGTSTVDLDLRFAPVDDDDQSDQRLATLTIASNDPDPTKATGFEMRLRGEGLRPAFSAAPSYCNYTRESDTCGLDTKNPALATFTLTNDGNVDVVIDAATFLNGGSGGRFTLASTLVGTTITANGGTHTFSVNYVDGPVFVQDFLQISANASGMAAGIVVLTIVGGTPPRITVDPEPIAFADGGTGATQTVNIGASADAGTLTVGTVTIDSLSAGQPNPFFKITSAPSAGTVVNPGQSVPVTVEYTRPPSGGSQESTMRIASNDPGYPAPEHRQVRIYSQGPPDFPPTAVLLGPDGQSQAIFLTRAQVSAGGDRVALDASTSFDTDPSGASIPVTDFEWRLDKKAGAASLVDSGGMAVDGRRSTTNTAYLTFSGPAAVGSYEIAVYVYDSVGNRSPRASLRVVVQE